MSAHTCPQALGRHWMLRRAGLTGLILDRSLPLRDFPHFRTNENTSLSHGVVRSR